MQHASFETDIGSESVLRFYTSNGSEEVHRCRTLIHQYTAGLNRSRKHGCINLIVNYEMKSELRYNIYLQEILKVFTF